MPGDRRQFLKSSGILLSVVVGGSLVRLSPAAARDAGASYLVLTGDEVATLESLAETVVPGAREAGVAHYLDKQLAASQEESLLMLKYLGVPQDDYLSFYRGGLHSTSALAEARFKKGWSQLQGNESSALVDEIATKAPETWSGPPASFFLFVIRSDAADVVYGTRAGFAELDIPYMAHIAPAEPW